MTGILSRLSRALSGRARSDGDEGQDWAPQTRPAADPVRPVAEGSVASGSVVDHLAATAAEVARIRRDLAASDPRSPRHTEASAVEEQLVRLTSRLRDRLVAGLEVTREEQLGAELMATAGVLITGDSGTSAADGGVTQ